MAHLSLLHLVLLNLLQLCILTEAQSSTPPAPKTTTQATEAQSSTPPAPKTTTQATGFIDLPASVAILESTRPRSVVVEFRVQSADPSPTVEIVSLIPESRVFETPIVSQVNASNIFTVQIVLNDSLDYETVGLHSVRLALVTAGGRVEQTFHVQVIDVNEPPQCQPLFQLPEDGIITTAFNLDLESDRSLEQRVLLVRAFSVSEGRRGTATVTVNVLDVNEHAPFCVPSIFVLTVPETTEIGKSLGTVMCGDIDISNHNVLLTLRDNDASLYKFRLQDGQLQVNGTLDYDTARIATNSFQYEATILVTDSRAPPLTTVIPVMVTVTPVNEFDPQFVGPFEIVVPEDAQWGSVVGTVKAMDADWRFDALLYSLPGGDALFSINPVGGQLYLKGSLDFEVKEVYSLRVQAVDFGQDVDLTVQRTGAVDITIRVQNLNDNPPVCDPVSYESNIFSTRSAGLPILTLSCTDRDRDPLTATITNGAAVDRFQMNGLTLSSRNAFSYVPGAVYDRTMFEVTIAVSDGKHTTDVVAYIYVVPWTTTVPTTTTTTTPKPPQVVTVVQEFWDPDRWFVVVLTITGALLLLSLALLIWKILTWTSVCATTDPEASDNLLKNSLDSEEPRKQDAANQNYQSSLDGTTSLPKEDSQKTLMRFDGKAEDPVSGRSYLFDSKTGERRWL
ncbi:cadherin-related family member 4-like [Anguilla anguilla]|uniref:cadherin-related family member 4-like n=1 Tax=Anguilla anguilla TaxID=7936 RepID=UPI0015AC85DB|nr:cadherin-related family member 4-like [Anguilla anguilla]